MFLTSLFIVVDTRINNQTVLKIRSSFMDASSMKQVAKILLSVSGSSEEPKL